MMHYTYKTQGTCSTQIDLDLEGNVIHHVEFTKGCNGNLKAVSALVEGKTVDEVISTLRGIHCGRKPTSCPDQLSYACEKAYQQEEKESAEQAGETGHAGHTKLT